VGQTKVKFVTGASNEPVIAVKPREELNKVEEKKKELAEKTDWRNMELNEDQSGFVVVKGLDHLEYGGVPSDQTIGSLAEIIGKFSDGYVVFESPTGLRILFEQGFDVDTLSDWMDSQNPEPRSIIRYRTGVRCARIGQLRIHAIRNFRTFTRSLEGHELFVSTPSKGVERLRASP
jgi:rRNA processing protein Gar1